MAFPQNVADRAMAACDRCCCLCHVFAGGKMECHHIVVTSPPDDSVENCIPLCFNCHAEVGHYSTQHPKGRKFTAEELKLHRRKWCDKIAATGQTVSSPEHLNMDRQLFSKIRTLVENVIRFTRTFSYSVSFDFSQHDPLPEIAIEGTKPDHEFMDAKVESCFAGFRTAADKFKTVLGVNVFSEPDGRLQVPRDWKGQPVEGELKRDKYDVVIAEITEASQEVCELCDLFIREGRRRLAVA